jgi:uncharacterized SAM-binding protein YcdF (DUF218 family)
LNIGNWLTTADVPGKADIVICLDGGSDRIDKAVSLLHNGLAEKVAVTTDEAYQQMLRKEVSADRILKADWSAESTYREGLLLKVILDKKVKSALVVSDQFHLFRAKWTLRHIFSDKLIAFSFISSEAPSLHGFWWSNPNSRLFVLSELPKIVYYWIWHGLLGIVEDPQWAIDLERAYMAFIRDSFILRMA